MKTIGLIGGMSWESTATYYQRINTLVKERLGGLHSARLVLVSLDFHEIEALQSAGQWDAAGQVLVAAAQSLQAAGAEALLICTNTMHKVAPAIEAKVSLPLLHIADATAEAIKQSGITHIGLLGTRFTMEQDFYLERLQKKHGLTVTVPEAADRARVNAIIYNELCVGELRDSSRRELLDIIDRLAARGAQGIILGCTELPLLINQAATPLPIFDTTELHARRAVAFALERI